MKIVDFHSHFFSRDYFEGLLRQSPLSDNRAYFIRRMSEDGIELPPENPQDHLNLIMQQMDTHLVDHMVLFASSADEIPTLARLLPDNNRFSGFAMFNPLVENASESLDKLHSMGFKGLVLFPVLHRYLPQDPALDAVFNDIERLGFVVTIHFGILKIRLRDLAGLPRTYGGQFSNPINLIEVADRYPGIPFIVPHFGNGFFRETLMLGANSPNICVDTSSSNRWIEYQSTDMDLAQIFRKTRHVFGAKRMFFGTDSGTFPRGYRKDVLESQLKAMAAAGFTREEIHDVMCNNARWLLGLPVKEEMAVTP
ncbi:MAG: amidohydrolase [Bacteroidetes bacterium]|nr:amidohydrolase [Bacteroidota bacterium]